MSRSLGVPWYLLWPLACAILYALGSVFIKRGLHEGATIEQSFHLSNFAISLSFASLLLLETQAVRWDLIWQPALMGVAFYFGGWLTFVAMRRGDVSLVTPLMGTKVVFVALGMTLLAGQAPPGTLWIAAILTALGIFLMGAKDLHGKVPGFIPVAAAALLSAATFGLCDVFVRMWAQTFGVMTFLALSSIEVSVISGLVILLRKKNRRQPLLPPKPAGRFIIGGSFIIGIQAIGVGLSLSYIDDATGINVVYSSRGLWAIFLVGWMGHHFGNHERHTAGAAFWWRMVGSLLLTAAIVLAVLSRVQ